MPTLPTAHPAATAYEAQLRICREGEERNNAQHELNSWLSALQSSTIEHPVNSNRRYNTAIEKVESYTDHTASSNNAQATFEDDRQRGNALFAKGMYQDAIQCYTRCLVHEEAFTTAVVYSNRGETCTHYTESILEALFTSSINLRISTCEFT